MPRDSRPKRLYLQHFLCTARTIVHVVTLLQLLQETMPQDSRPKRLYLQHFLCTVCTYNCTCIVTLLQLLQETMPQDSWP